MISLKDLSCWMVIFLWSISKCCGYKRALTDYATPSYVSSTSSPNTLLIPTGQENVAAALLRASLMFDEEGLQYPYYDIQHNSVDKVHSHAYGGMQRNNGGHLQYFYNPTFTNSQPTEIVYGTAKTEEADNGVVYGRPRDRLKDHYLQNLNYNQFGLKQNMEYNHEIGLKQNFDSFGAKQNLNYNNNLGLNQNYVKTGDRLVYFQPIEHTREEYGRAVAYHQMHPEVQTQLHPQVPQIDTTQNRLHYSQYVQPSALYPTQPTYSSDFRPSEEYHEPETLQHLDRPHPSPTPTPKPQASLDYTDKPHLSTTRQQALLTQYFKNIAAQNKEEQVEEESKEKEDENEEEASRYKFGYRITDSVTGMEYGQAEAREGEMTRGHYHVLLPDGRMQHVHYWSDDSGYHATISYDDGPRQKLS